jgi:hypothetical protein
MSKRLYGQILPALILLIQNQFAIVKMRRHFCGKHR